MASSANLWQAWNAAKTWSCRPSEIYGVDDDYAAYCFDSAVATFGRALEAELEGVEGKKKDEIQRKQRKILEKWIPEMRRAGTQRFRDPMEKINNAGL